MTAYFLLIELLFFAFVVYLRVVKKEFAVIYLPVLFFTRLNFSFSTRMIFWYMILAGMIVYLMYTHRGFTKNNPYAILLAVYFTILLFFSSSISSVRPAYTSTTVLFLSIPIIHNLYKIYGRPVIEKELYKMSVIILLLFISNTVMSTVTGYTGGRDMYGLGGLSYGHMFATNFNIIPVVLFFLLYKLTGRYTVFGMAIAIISFALVVLSMRRSVFVTAVLAGAIFVLMLLMQRNKSNAFITIYAVGATVLIVVLSTGVLDTFWERYEGRGLGERDFLSGREGRFIEYQLVYSDMFIYHRYNPITGYELFNSGGNYGNGIFGERSLHSDITAIVHASGLVGLLLYLLMIFRAFNVSYKLAWSRIDKLIILFCAIALIIYSLTGRFTNADYMIVLFLIVLLPLTKN